MSNKSPAHLLQTDKYDYSFDPKDRSSLALIAAQIPPGSSVLEFGPAHGRLTRYLQQHLGCRVSIVEIDAAAAQEASQYAVETLVGDAMDYGWLDKFGQKRFDVILFADVLEHLNNPWEVLSRAVDLLHDDGWIWISLPNIAHNAVLIDLFNDHFRYQQDGLLDATHIRFFTKESLSEMVQACGLYPAQRLTTVCSVLEMSFGNCYEHVPPSLAHLLKNRNGGEIFQYVFGCVRQSYHARGGLQKCDEVDLLPGVTAQLYLDIGQGFSEGVMLERFAPYGEHHVEFDLSGRGNICSLRFDPCVNKTIIQLSGVQTISEQGSTTVGEDQISSNCTSRAGGLFVFDHDDPQFLISFGDEGEPLARIVFDIRYLVVGKQLPCLDAEVIAVGGLPQAQLQSGSAGQGGAGGAAADPSVQVWLYDLVRQKNLVVQKLKNELNACQNNQNKLLELEQVNANLLEMLAERDAEIVRQRAVNADILSSGSWKMGEPLRRVIAGVHNLKSLISSRPAGMERSSDSESEVLTQEALSVEERFFVRLWQGYLRDVHDGVPRLRERADSFTQTPLISLVMSVPVSGFGALSVFSHILEQVYPFWELHVFLSDGLEKAQQEMADTRIHLHAVSENVSFPEVLSGLLEKIEATYVLFLDSNTSLTPHALLHLAEVMSSDKPGMLYTDGVAKLGGGSALRFIFRPAFAPEWLRAFPYIDHLLALRIDLAKRFGPAVASKDGVCLSELARCLEGQGEEVAHIAEPLYVSVLDAQQGDQSLDGRWLRDSTKERVELPCRAGVKVAIVIPSKDRGELVQQCVESIERTAGSLDYGIFVVNHDSTDPITLEYFQRITGRHTIIPYSGSFNFSVINNLAVSMIPPDFTHILFCNNDIEACRAGWLERLLACCQRPGVGVAGALLLFPGANQLIQHGGVCLGMLGAAEHYGKFLPAFTSETPLGALEVCHEVSAVTAACMLVNRADFEAVGGYDEELAIGFGDVDLCLRIGREGRKILYCPHAILLHHESASRDRGTCDPHPEDTALFYRKWQDAICQGDPYFSPHYDLHNYQWRPRDPLSYTGDVNVRLTTGQGIVRSMCKGGT